jgi:signal transduction histidine kinase
LAICRKLIARMGGQLAVDSSAERGTRFAFSLELPHTTAFDIGR